MPLPSSYWSKDEIEERTIARFLEHINQARSSDFKLAGRNVPTGGRSSRNFDALLVNSVGWRIAMDIFGLHRPNKEEADVRYFDSLGILACRELEMLGVQKAWLIFGHRVERFPGRIQQVAAELAREIAEKISGPAAPAEFEVRGVKVKTNGVLDAVTHDRFVGRWGDGFDVVLHHLNQLLPEKNGQLATIANERIVLVGAAYPFRTGVVQRAVDAANLAQYRNIDKLIYEYSAVGEYIVLHSTGTRL